MFPWHLELGFLNRPWMEGLYFAISIIVAWWVAVQVMKQHKMDLKNGEKLLGWAVASAFLGARISHFIFWYPERWTEFLNLAGGGFSITGGLIGGFLGGFIYARLAKMDFYGIFARLSPSVLLGQAIGRLGCFLNGDAHGTATDLPWGVEFPRYGVSVPSFQLNQTLDSPAWQWAAANNHIASPDAIRTLPLHPTQLYEAFFDLGLGLGIWWLANFLLSNKKSAKIIFYIHTGGYALFRALVEYIRGDRRVVLALDTSLLQYTFFAVSIFAFVKIALEAISLSKPEAALKNS